MPSSNSPSILDDRDLSFIPRPNSEVLLSVDNFKGWVDSILKAIPQNNESLIRWVASLRSNPYVGKEIERLRSWFSDGGIYQEKQDEISILTARNIPYFIIVSFFNALFPKIKIEASGFLVAHEAYKQILAMIELRNIQEGYLVDLRNSYGDHAPTYVLNQVNALKILHEILNDPSIDEKLKVEINSCLKYKNKNPLWILNNYFPDLIIEKDSKIQSVFKETLRYSDGKNIYRLPHYID